MYNIYMKQTKKYKEDIENFGEPERKIDTIKYVSAIIAVNILVWGGIGFVLYFLYKTFTS